MSSASAGHGQRSAGSVEADFYDWLILRELEKQPEQFHEGRFIGELLGKYPMGLGDFQLAQRMELLISHGILTPVTVPEEGCPVYHRWLRKV